MDLATLLGALLGIGLIFWAIAMGGNLSGYFDPSSVLITIGGTLAATLAGNQLRVIPHLLRLILLTLRNHFPDPQDLIAQLVVLAQKARRDGLLSLDEDAQQLDDPFLRKGLELIVDGVEPEAVRAMLEMEIAAMSERHRYGIQLLRKMAGAAPAFGMIGTLIGLIRMLANLDDPNKIGPGLATALLTTLYGTLLANLVFTPMANKLELLDDREVAYRELCMAGILAIQAGDSPRFLRRKLASYLPPRQRELGQDGESPPPETQSAQREEVAVGG